MELVQSLFQAINDAESFEDFKNKLKLVTQPIPNRLSETEWTNVRGVNIKKIRHVSNGNTYVITEDLVILCIVDSSSLLTNRDMREIEEGIKKYQSGSKR